MDTVVRFDLESFAIAQKDGIYPLARAKLDGGVHAQMRVEPDHIDRIVEN